MAYNSNGASSAYYAAVTETTVPHHFYVYKFSHDAVTPTQLDTAGGNWGTAINFLPAGGGTESQPNAIAIFGSDVVIAGSNKTNSSTPPWSCAVAALNQLDGSLDTSFGHVGIAGGVNSTGISIFSADGATPTHDCIVNNVVPNGTSDLFLLGSTYSGTNHNYDYLAMYLDATGPRSIVSGTNGFMTLGLGPADDFLNAATLISGYAYVVGRSQNSLQYNGGDIERVKLSDGE